MLSDTMPRYAIYRNRKVRIVDYEDDWFEIVTPHDDRRTWVHRRMLRMVKS
jgi:hypothetical protein